jgi:hypothetical protein
MERCIFKYVHSFLLKNILITKFLSGFRPGDSTVNQLISISNDFGKAIDDGKEIRIIFNIINVNRKKSIGPSIEPWGTPAFIDLVSEVSPFINTC